MDLLKALKVEQWPIERLIPYARNPRKNDEQVDRMASAIREFGFRIPVVAKSDGSVVDGHLRLKAAKQLGLKEIPVALADDLTEAQVKAFRILANQSANWAEWDTELLRLELEDLRELDYDIALTGFEPGELAELTGAVEDAGGLTDPDAVPDVVENEPPVSTPGDIWLLGKHRLLCGDSTDAGCVGRVMTGQKADMVITDPPYGVKRDKGFGGATGFNGKGEQIKRREYSDNWDAETPPKECFDCLLKQAEFAIIWGGNFFTDKLPQSNFWLVWDKHNTMPTFGDCELAWTNIKRNSVKKYDFEYNGLIGKEKERFHPTQKPVALCTQILKDFSKEQDIILDLFGGSGTTLIACEQTGRVCRMMEIDPHYCDVIVRRWQDFTGKQAVHEGSGKTFAETAEERG